MSGSDARDAAAFRDRADTALADARLRLTVLNATASRDGRRRARWGEFPDIEAVRALAEHIKDHTLDNLDHYLAQLIDRFKHLGVTVHLASTAEEANNAVIEIAREHECSNLVKSKSMLTEELHLNDALEAAGLRPLETDLGEFLLQLDRDRPSHITAPAVHLDVAACADAFARHLDGERIEDPRALVGIARRHMRDAYRRADMAITGVNFAVAESGTIILAMNEGNGRFCVLNSRVHVAMMGIEKIVPTLRDAAVLLKLLGRSGTAQKLTVDTHFITGPRRSGDGDGPEQMHVIIVDAGRSDVLGGKYRDVLRCIRCGACLNTCPVYRSIGGHAYGGVYPGPIGKLLTPLFEGGSDADALPHASSLCGACMEACPVRINIPHLLVELRRDQVDRSRSETKAKARVIQLAMRAMRSPTTYVLGQKLIRRLLGWRARNGWIARAPGPFQGWTDADRDLPAMPRCSFRELWKQGRI